MGGKKKDIELTAMADMMKKDHIRKQSKRREPWISGHEWDKSHELLHAKVFLNSGVT